MCGFSHALPKSGLSEERVVVLTLTPSVDIRNLECRFRLPAGVNAFTCRGKWLYMLR
ncbi:hypothetical protein BFAG_00229 [Bacteroides fragilis 3_1_12]|uniref:Uncharacterized protein n=1 Tax=Bacteroides fragilis 3_1_12 TaxID=457424 RepID=A0ABN0BF28_BACFG|nr:hypothetical protein BFAG_00229 [Bacteroides fragilis 3_1_12]